MGDLNHGRRTASRPRKVDSRITTSVRMSGELHSRLQEAAEDRDVSFNWLVARLLEEGIERLVPAKDLLLTRDRQTKD